MIRRLRDSFKGVPPVNAVQPERPQLLARLLAATAGWCAGHPWIVCAFTLISVGLSILYTLRNVTYETQRNDLHNKNTAYYQRWRNFVEEFGDDDDVVAVIEGPNRAAILPALEELASRVQKQPEHFDRLFYQVDLRSLQDRALLFLPSEQIRSIQDRIKDLSLLLEPPVLAGLDPLFGWKSLTLLQLLQEGRARISDPVDPFFGQLAAIVQGAANEIDQPDQHQNPWQRIIPADPDQADRLAKPQFFFSGDEELAFFLVRPNKDGGDGNFTFNQQSIEALRSILQELENNYPHLRFGVTGLPVLENDEMVATQADSNFASWLALAGVALLYLVVYRGWRYPFMTVVTLLVGTVWALGWLTLTVGHLNILSSAFAVMLIGMGDYGVLWVTRFGQERLAGRDPSRAMRETALHVGPSILTASLTTALAFFAAMLADLKAVAELGWIAGSGVILCAIACFLVMPALLAIFDFQSKNSKPADPSHDATILPHPETLNWLPGLMRRPRWVVAATLLAALGLSWFAMRIPYDHNLLRLQDPSLASVQWEHRLIDKTAGASWHACSVTNTPEEALALKAKYEQLDCVSRVVEVAALVPRDQEHKLRQLADIHQRLRRLPNAGTLIPHAMPDSAEVVRAARQLMADLKPAQAHPGIEKLRASLTALVSQLTSVDETMASKSLKLSEERLVLDLVNDLHQLRAVSNPRPIQLADLPVSLRERYVGKQGKWLLRIFAKDCLWEYPALQHFTTQVQTVDPEATGKPFTTFEGLRAMKHGFSWAGFYALLAMVLVLFLDFGTIKHTLIALLPLALGLIFTLGIMVLGGYSLNPANMIAFPLILGVGADNGVHVLHDFRDRRGAGPYRLNRSTGRGILVAALTTILGFGTLMIAQHRGLASLGLVLTLGVTCCMLTALVFLPAMLGLASKKWEECEPIVLPWRGKRAA